MPFRHTRYLGGGRFESECVKCGEALAWTDGHEPSVVAFSDQDFGFLCQKCYECITRRNGRNHCPNRAAGKCDGELPAGSALEDRAEQVP